MSFLVLVCSGSNLVASRFKDMSRLSVEEIGHYFFDTVLSYN